MNQETSKPLEGELYLPCGMSKSTAKRLGLEIKGGDIDFGRKMPTWRDKASAAVNSAVALGIVIVFVGAILTHISWMVGWWWAWASGLSG